MNILPILFGFFVMGFVDVVGTATFYVQTECGLSNAVAGFLPSMIYVWFLVASIPAGLAANRWGRKNMVLVSLVITLGAMLAPLAGGPSRAWVYFLSFALLGLGNTIIQAALPALLSNVVSGDQLTSRISLGQFVKAICAALSPVIAGLAAQTFGNWKLLFPIYGALTLASAVWLALMPIPREKPSEGGATFLGSASLLANPFVLAMFCGILFSVAADVGFNFSIPPYLRDVCGMDANTAAMAPSVYFIAKTVGSFVGAIVLAKFAPARCFPLTVVIALAGTVGILFVQSPWGALACVAVASFGLANTFGIPFGLAMGKMPERTNEVAALMVMAIAAGGVVTPILGAAQGVLGAVGLVYVLTATVAALGGIAMFTARKGH